MKRTALLSVYNKQGIIGFANSLLKLDFNLIASGGTSKALKEAGLLVTDIADLVGGGPILGHRVVTLSREVHAGLLAKDNEEDRAELERLGIPFIDLVYVDLYPLQEEINNPFATIESVLEKTDIGGPTMLSSGAKGRRIVISNNQDVPYVLGWLKKDCPNKDKFLNKLAVKADLLVAKYRAASAEYHSKGAVDIYLNVDDEFLDISGF